MATVHIKRSFIAPGDYSFEVPSGLSNIYATCCGGGGGSAVSATSNSSGAGYDTCRATAKNGDSSYIKINGEIKLNAGGGGGGNVSQVGRNAYDGDPHLDVHPGAAGSPNGNPGKIAYDSSGGECGDWTTASGGGGRTLNGVEYGRGGNVGKDSSEHMWASGVSGGSGGYITGGPYPVSEHQIIYIHVGDGGNPSINRSTLLWKKYSFYIEKGKSGFVIIWGDRNTYSKVPGDNITKNSAINKTNFKTLIPKVDHVSNEELSKLRSAITLLEAHVAHVDNCNNCNPKNCCELECGCQSQICQSQNGSSQSCQSECKYIGNCYTPVDCVYNCDCGGDSDGS